MSSESSESSPLPLPLAGSLASYVELGAQLVPQRKLGIKDRLRCACPFLPMPLCLGWDADPREDEVPHDGNVPGLMLSDIGSGATRLVTARWMHALYKRTREKHPPGTIVIDLQEANFTAHFSWAHAVVVLTFLSQLGFIVFALTSGQRREGSLLLAAALIRILDGILAYMYPKYKPPRSDKRMHPRYCALHTGMTTNHILVISHMDTSLRGDHVSIVMEDAAVPLPRNSDGWKEKLENLFHALLKIAPVAQKGASLITAATGYTIPLVLLLGTIVLELVSFLAGDSSLLPQRTVRVLTTGSSLLDRITAACQFTGSTSVAFVENLLPDPRGRHTDYEWIMHAMNDKNLELHPTHPLAQSILESTLRRRTPAQVQVIAPAAPTYPPPATVSGLSTSLPRSSPSLPHP